MSHAHWPSSVPRDTITGLTSIGSAYHIVWRADADTSTRNHSVIVKKVNDANAIEIPHGRSANGVQIADPVVMQPPVLPPIPVAPPPVQPLVGGAPTTSGSSCCGQCSGSKCGVSPRRVNGNTGHDANEYRVGFAQHKYDSTAVVVTSGFDVSQSIATSAFDQSPG